MFKRTHCAAVLGTIATVLLSVPRATAQYTRKVSPVFASTMLDGTYDIVLATVGCLQ